MPNYINDMDIALDYIRRYVFFGAYFLEDIDVYIKFFVGTFWVMSILIVGCCMKRKSKKSFLSQLVFGLLVAGLYGFFFQPTFKGDVEIFDFETMKKNEFQDKNFDKILHIQTYNLRDSTIDVKKNTWGRDRFTKVVENIKLSQPDIIGTQEAQSIQLKDLFVRGSLKENYQYLGLATSGDSFDSALVYNQETIEEIENGTFWLSHQPDNIGSQFEEASRPRSCTWGLFRFKTNGKQFYVFNTHLEHMYDLARQKQVVVLIKEMKKIIEGKDIPVFITGDFNSFPTSKTYNIVRSQGFKDVRLVDSSKNHQKNVDFTFNAYFTDNFMEKWYVAGAIRQFLGICNYIPFVNEYLPVVFNPPSLNIDFIFQGGNQTGINLRETYILNHLQDGRFSSDHFPISAFFDF